MIRFVTVSVLAALLAPTSALADAECWDERGRCWYAVEGAVSCECADGTQTNQNVGGGDLTPEQQHELCQGGLDSCGDDPGGIVATCEEDLRGACLVRHRDQSWRANCECADGSAFDGGWADDEGDPEPTQSDVDQACAGQLDMCPISDPGPDKVSCEADWGTCSISQNGTGGCRCDDSGWTDGWNPDDQEILSEFQMREKCDAYLQRCRGDGGDEDGDEGSDDSDPDDDADVDPDHDNDDPKEDSGAASTGQGSSSTTGDVGDTGSASEENSGMTGASESSTGSLDATSDDGGDPMLADEADAPGQTCAVSQNTGAPWFALLGMMTLWIRRRR